MGEPSRGYIFPKHRGDLVEAAVVTRRMQDGLIESTRYLRNPLDVLAQQIVAHLAVGPCSVDDLATLVRRCASFADLTEDLLVNVLDLLAGRYPSEEFGELRPRIVWDRVGGELRARDGARRLAVTSGGTIPDRGLFGVFLPDGTRVGELDEEMVYESRPGETFLLGASTWRIEDISFERVVVTPAPGQPGKMPFWHGDRPGRPLELGRALGAFLREVRELPPAQAEERLRTHYGLDAWAAANVVLYLAEQVEAAGVVPDDRTLVVERFRDEIGDWRVCLLSPFGTPVHAPWAMAIERRLMERYELPVETMWSDDGIVIRLPEAADDLPIDELLIDPEDIEELVVSTLPQTSLFSARFRECAARALLLPRRRPDSPHAALAAAPAGRRPAGGGGEVPELPDPARGQPGVPAGRVRRPRPAGGAGPAAQPPGAPGQRGHGQGVTVRAEPAVQLDRRLHVRGRRAAGRAAGRGAGPRPGPVAGAAGRGGAAGAARPGRPGRPGARAAVPHGRAAGARARTSCTTSCAGWATSRRPSSTCGRRARARPCGWPSSIAERRAITVRIGDEERVIAAEDAARYRDALGCAIPVGLPMAFTDPVARPLEHLVGRYARTHGPFLADAPARRFALAPERVAGALAALEAEDRLVRGEFRPDGVEREWCDVEVLRQLRRRSLAALRREVEPVEQEALARFLPAWHGIPSHRRGLETLVEAIGLLQGAPLVASTLERDVLPARVLGYRSGDLDELCTSGDLVWVGAGGLGASDGRVRLAFRDQLPLLGLAG